MAVLAGAAADFQEPGALLMTSMDAPLRLEAGAEPANSAGLADQVERFGAAGSSLA